MPIDPFAKHADNRNALGLRGRNVTPNGEDVDLDVIPKAIMAATDGLLSYVPANNADDEIVTLVVTAGFCALHRPRRIKASTTCIVWTAE